LVPDPDVTPVLQPFLSAEVRGENIHVSGVLDGALAWSYRIWRHPVGTSADRADPVLESDHPPGAGAIELIDHPASGTYRYEIEASPAPPLAAPVMRAWSNAVRFEPGVQTRIRAFPDPWNGIGSVRLQRAGLRGATRISVVTVGGRQIATWTWPSGDSETTWEGTDASGRAVPSGVYFLGLRDEVGRLLDVTTIVVER
jgi:hypothetical protein